MSGQIRSLALVLLSVSAVAAFVLLATAGNRVSAGSGGMDAMAIDMGPGAEPANTATSIGSRQFCARLNENGQLDADEDAVDTLQFDVTTGPLGIPASNPMIAFQAEILLDTSVFEVTAVNTSMLLAAAEGSEIFDASDPIPNGDLQPGRFVASALDIGAGENADHAESGPGVLARLTIAAAQGATPGLRDLILGHDSVHLDPQPLAQFPDLREHGIVALGVECPLVQPTPRPTPTPVPRPSPIPGTPGGPPPPTTVPPTPVILPGPGVVSISATSAHVDPGEAATIAIKMLADSPGVGAIAVDLFFDPALVEAGSCITLYGACNPEYAPGIVRVAAADAAGLLAGDVSLATIEFTAGQREGISSLTPHVQQVADPDGADLPFYVSSGYIQIGSATPSPIPQPTSVTSPTPAPTLTVPAPGTLHALWPPNPTPIALPQTGGDVGNGGAGAAVMLLAVGALAVLGAASWLALKHSRRR